jgi:hypothetical protein
VDFRASYVRPLWHNTPIRKKKGSLKMTNYEIKVFPKVGEPFVNSYSTIERYSIAVNAYSLYGIKIECDRSLVVDVNTFMSVLSNYAGD